MWSIASCGSTRSTSPTEPGMQRAPLSGRAGDSGAQLGWTGLIEGFPAVFGFKHRNQRNFWRR